MRLLRDLQAQPDNQAYLCNFAETAGEHGLPLPFRCGCRQWIGGGIVRIMFYTPTSRGYMESALVPIKSLTPLPGETFTFNDPPL